MASGSGFEVYCRVQVQERKDCPDTFSQTLSVSSESKKAKDEACHDVFAGG